MVLDKLLLKLEAVMSGAATSVAPEVTVNYIIYNTYAQAGTTISTKPQTFRAALNGATDVTILAAPLVANEVRQPIGIYLYNKDSAAITVTIKTDDGTTERIMVKKTLAVGETLCWDTNSGWYII